MLATRRAGLAERELALSQLRGQLFSFEGRYIRQVGVLYKQLDEWEERIAELHAKTPSLDEMESPAEDQPLMEATPLLPDLRALFREVAKRIHPDFAADTTDEQRRTRLMARANDAYLRRDFGLLQRMLDGFDPRDGAETRATEAEIAATQLLIRQIEQDIKAAEADLTALAESEMAKLQTQTIEAALKGRDLLAEMAARVKGRIGMAMRQYDLDLDRIKRPDKGLKMETLVTAETSRQPRYDAKRRTWVK